MIGPISEDPTGDTIKMMVLLAISIESRCRNLGEMIHVPRFSSLELSD